MTFEALSNAALSPDLMVAVVFKVSLVMTLAWLATFLVRSLSASGRHLVWTVALAVALVLPALLPIVPAWSVPLPFPHIASTGLMDRVAFLRPPQFAVEAVTEPPLTVTARPSNTASVRGLSGANQEAVVPAGTRFASASEGTPPSVGAILPAGPDGNDALTTARSESELPVSLLFLVWAAGAMLVATPWLAGVLRLSLVGRGAPGVRTTRSLGMLEAVASEMHIHRKIRLIEGPPGTIPMTWGIVRPVVLLPAGVDAWSNARLRTVLRHELAHIARCDAHTQALAELACIVHWYNPLVWLAARRQREEQERACDDRVLSCGEDAADYAAQLVALARGIRRARSAPLPAMAIASEAPLRDRLIAVLDDGRSRSGINRHHVLRGALIGLFTVLPLACMTPASRTTVAATPTPRDEPAVEIDAETPRPPQEARSPRADTRPEPAPARSRAPARPRTPSVRPTTAEAPPTSVTPPEPPSRVTVARQEQPVSPPPRPTGAVTTPQPLQPPTARSGPPSAATVPRAPRETARSRAPTVVTAPEPPRPTATRPAASPAQAADPALVVQVLRHATARGLGDRQMVELLAVTVQTGSLANSAVRTAYIAAAATIDSDRDRATGIEALIVNGNARSDDFEALLGLSAGISSDAQVARLLLTVLEHTEITDRLRGPFLRALDTIGSDREKNRVSAELVRRGG